MAERQATLTGSGHWDGDIHCFPLRVYYEDTDAGGIVYHARYLHFAERARTEMLRLLGVAQPELIAREGAGFAVRRAEVDFLRPARLDDALMVRTRTAAVSGASMDLRQRINRATDEQDREETVADLLIRLAVVNAKGRPVRLPQAVRQACAKLAPTDARKD
ncbi:MAG: tol-pal system-associated acyl-CoA thioesterase [Alphaproteobacteria bacterium]|nr:tol-pal system-associated acyl-CoA thioesterase [Alphaproteobacteria bacterium]